MKKFNALELLRLVTFLPLIIVLIAMVDDERNGTFPPPDKIVNQEQQNQVTLFQEG